MADKGDTTTGLKDVRSGYSLDNIDSPSIGFSSYQAQITIHELLKKLSKKNRYDLVIKDITKSVQESHNLEGVLETSVAAFSKNIDKVDFAGIYTIEDNVAVLKSHSGLGSPYVEKAGIIPHQKGPIWKTIVDGKPLYCADVDKDFFVENAGSDSGIKSFLSIPIYFQGEVVGVISINSCQKNAFDEDELKLLEIIAQEIGIAFSNAEQAEVLRLSEERYHILFNQSPVGVYIFDKNYRIVQCNYRFVQILNSSYDKIIGVDIRNLKNKHVVPSTEKVLSGESAYYEDLYKPPNRSSMLWVSVRLSPLRDAEGNVIGGMAILEDITRHKENEYAIDVLRHRNEMILNSAGEGIFGVDLEGKITFVNQAAARTTGWGTEELIGMVAHDALHHSRPDGTPYLIGNCPIYGALREGISGIGDNEAFFRKDGTIFPVEYLCTPVREGDKLVGGVVTFSDISERKRSEEDLYVKNRELEILNTITQAVHQTIDIEKVYDVALDMVSAIENVDMIMIYLVDDERKEAILQTHRNLPDDYIIRAGRIPYPKGITWKVIESGEVYNVKDAQTDPNIGPAGRDLGHHSVLGVPITSEGNVIGVIWFLSYKEREFVTEEVELLSSIGNQVAMAIGRANLYLELSKKKRYEEIISAVTRSVHHSLDLQKVLENAVCEINKNMENAENVGIYLVEGEGAVLKAYSGSNEWFISQLKKIPYPRGFIWRTIIEGKSIYCADVDEDTAIGQIGREAGTKSYVSMPIFFEGKAIGALGMSSFSKKNAFDDYELKLLNTVVHQIEIAIRNARRAEMLRDSEERFRKLSESVRVIPWESDPHRQKFTYIGPQAVSILGYPIEACYGEGFWEEHINTEDKESVIGFCRASAGRSESYEVEYRMTAADGGTKWLNDIVSVISNGRQPKLLRGMMFDITERKNAEEELQKAHDELEERVSERTLKFVEANRALQKEIRQRRRIEEELRYSEERYRALHDHNPSMYYTVNRKGTVLSVNNFGAEQLGYTPEELIGRSVLTVFHAEDRKGIMEQLRLCLKHLGRIYNWEFRKIRKGGIELWARGSARAVKSPDGIPVILMVCEDITEHKRVQEQINKSLMEKEVLLKEIHHRVKNNLQVISSLLSIQSRFASDRKVQDIFNESRNRIKSMALIHEQLYKSNDLAKIECGEYVRGLVEHLFQSYRANLNNIKCSLNVQEIYMHIDTAINCGLIINELVSNSLKHAFSTDRLSARRIKTKGEVCIELCSEKNSRADGSGRLYTLVVSNNGLAFPEDLDFRNTETLGLQLVGTLVEQLEGTIELDRSTGTTFKITFNA